MLRALETMAKKEVQDLEDLGILVRNVNSAWGFPSFFRGKKDEGMHFLTDLRKLNELLERNPYPLPNIDDIIWKVGGFTYATCFDLNRGYYHFKINTESQKLCSIILPWGRYSYTKLPQGLMVTSDIFQAKMVEIFGHLSKVIVYIDNILLFTKSDFNDHLQRMQQVLELIQKNNLHVHV